MTINAADIKLLESERMTDTSDGGGRRTSRVVPDGIPGNIFPKVSRLDSVYGRVNLRKVFAQVDTANLDVYAGAHCAIIDEADNSKIAVTIFSTRNDFDDRTAARDRIESYVIAGPETRMVLYGRQLVGQGAIAVYQKETEALPDVGEVFCLSKETAGVINYQQFVRTTDISHEVRTFEDDRGEFKYRILTIKISTPLRYEFAGPDTPQRFSSAARPALVRATTVADASRYYGIQKVAEPAAADALEIKVASVYTPIVPTTQRETALSSVQMAGAEGRQAVAPAGLITQTFPTLVVGSGRIEIPLGGSIRPGSFTASVDANPHSTGMATWTYLDLGDGTVQERGPGGQDYGKHPIDYENGIFFMKAIGGGSQSSPTEQAGLNNFRVSYEPSASITQVAHTMAQSIDLNTRGTVFVKTLNPLPAPGSLVIDYRALGKWYRLRDLGTGEISGSDPAYGTGTITYSSGALVVTLGALPDVDSSVLFSWGSPAHYKVLAGADADTGTTVSQAFTLPETPVVPESLTIKYMVGTTENTATCTSAGVITGPGVTGELKASTGEVSLAWSGKLPNVATSLTVAYNKTSAVSQSQPATLTGTVPYNGDTLLVLPEAIKFGTLKLRAYVMVPGIGSHGPELVALDLRDGTMNDSGKLTVQAKTFNAAGRNWAVYGGTLWNGGVGTVQQPLGQVSLSGKVVLTASAYNYETGGWAPTQSYPLDFVAGDYEYTYTSNNEGSPVPADQVQVSLSDSPIRLDLTKTQLMSVLPGTIRFDMTGYRCFDRNGTIYTTQMVNTYTLELLALGSINYDSGEITLSHWKNDTTLGLTVRSCLGVWGEHTTDKVQFRTAGSPLRPESFIVQATREDGTLVTATSDQAGNVSGVGVTGTINNDNGVAAINFGGAVVPATIRYSAVALSNLPLDADVLGLDPVRLPSDGRVPIYRPADVVLIHNTKNTTLPALYSSATYSVGRTDLSDLYLIDANGARVSTAHYAVNLATGTVTMAATFPAIPEPVVARHRVEELNLLSDVQINGTLSLTGPLTRDYDADTRVSSSLLFGDMFARVTNVFDQVSWTSVWSDARIGNNGTSEYDTVNYPIEVLNSGAVTERWRINFTSTTAFQVIGENLGVIATGTTTADCSPTNQLTGKPYFTIRAAGWGAGWSVGQQLRFNTIGATGAVWLARTVLPGAALTGDSIDLQVRGDVDA